MSTGNNPPLIAVVDDERDLLEMMRLYLIREGFTVACFEDASSLRIFLKSHKPDILLLDRMLPDAEGLDICREIRQNPSLVDITVIMVTAKSDEMERIVGLEIGADDYVVKPFSPRELIARIRARLRNYASMTLANPLTNEGKMSLFNGRLIIDSSSFEVTLEGKLITLTTTEFRILRLLAEKPGRVYRRDEILDGLWGGQKIVSDRTIDVHISNLRDKMGSFASAIRNIKGVGYKIDVSSDADF